MAASSSSTSSSFDASTAMAYSSSFPSSPMVVTREEFNEFHKIDRTLFVRLVFGLARDVGQSAQVVAFLLWLEHSGQARNLVYYLISLPDTFINAVAEEVVICLNCMCYDDFSLFSSTFGFRDNYDNIPFIKRLTRNKLTLRFIHENRETILRGFTKNLTEICNRAFEDIYARSGRFNKEKALVEERKKAEEEMNRLMTISHVRIPDKKIETNLGDRDQSGLESALQNLALNDHQEGMNLSSSPTIESQTSKLQPDDSSSTDQQVSPDDRTIFLTFSKGYPISESEVQTFFSRFGDVIEVIHMQEVEDNEQPLYARMVLHNGSIIPMMLGGRSKNKFTINGKHVWARKYVRKNPKSPSSSFITPF